MTPAQPVGVCRVGVTNRAHAVVVVRTITLQIDGFSCPIASDG